MREIPDELHAMRPRIAIQCDGVNVVVGSWRSPEDAQFIVDACNVRERAKFILSDFEVTGRWGGDVAMLAQLHDLIPATPDPCEAT